MRASVYVSIAFVWSTRSVTGGNFGSEGFSVLSSLGRFIVIAFTRSLVTRNYFVPRLVEP